MQRPALVILLIALAAPALAQDGPNYVPYHQLRQENPAIDEAIGHLSSSDLHGTLNRLSSLFTRSQVRDLPAGTLEADLPENVTRGLQAALEDLRLDLDGADADLAASGLTPEEITLHEWVLAQTVSLVFADRMLDLADTGIACASSDPAIDCPYTGGVETPTLDAFGESLTGPAPGFLAQPLAEWVEEVRTILDDAGDPLLAFTATGLNPRTVAGRVEYMEGRLVVLPGNTRITGVEHIDFE
jgi:hypothetical protein